MKKIEANDLILRPTTPINVVKLIALSCSARLSCFQLRSQWKILVFIVSILANISKTLGFIIPPSDKRLLELALFSKDLQTIELVLQPKAVGFPTDSRQQWLSLQVRLGVSPVLDRWLGYYPQNLLDITHKI